MNAQTPEPWTPNPPIQKDHRRQNNVRTQNRHQIQGCRHLTKSLVPVLRNSQFGDLTTACGSSRFLLSFSSGHSLCNESPRLNNDGSACRSRCSCLALQDGRQYVRPSNTSGEPQPGQVVIDPRDSLDTVPLLGQRDAERRNDVVSLPALT